MAARYEAVCLAFDELRECTAVWHIGSSGRVQNAHQSKRNAGATSVVERQPTRLVYALPHAIKSNIVPPAARVGRQTLYFLPDMLLVEDGLALGGVAYADLEVEVAAGGFIESDRVPRDAVITGHTWRYPNRDGGPDRRFRDNRQIPVCRYEALALSSASGVSEMLQFSRVGPAATFATALAQLVV